MNHTSAAPHLAHLANAKIPLPPVAIARNDYDRLAAIASTASDSAGALAAYLNRELGRARIVEHAPALSGVICMGDIVTYRDEATHARHTVQLVYPEDANPEDGRLSVLSSVGVALIGLRRNSSIEWFTPSGHSRMLTILDVVKTSDEDQDSTDQPSPNDRWIVRLYESAKAQGLTGHDAFVKSLKDAHRLEPDQSEDQLRARVQRVLNAHLAELDRE